jgi:hypothetical protein
MGKGGGRKGRDTTGYHKQGPPRDKFDPDWKPRRGRKKAKKQAAVFARKYNEWLRSQGVPDQSTQEHLETASDSSGFPNFPGVVERLAELEG